MRTLLGGMAIAILASGHAAAETEIEVHYAMPDVFGEIQEKIAQRFMEENPDITVSFRSPSDSYEDGVQRLLREGMADDLPDVAYVGLNRIRVLEERDLAQPLEPFIESQEAFSERGFTESILSLGQVRGEQYGLAFSASTPVVYANMDLVREAGYEGEFPSDWDSLIELGREIDELGEEYDGIYYHFWGSDWMWQAALGSFGGRPMNEDETEVTFDEEPGIQAANLLAKFREEGNMPGYDREAAQQSFQAGRLGIMLDSSAFLQRLESGTGERFDFQVHSFPIADPENAYLPTGGAGSVMLTEDPEKQEAAWRYMTYASGPEGAAIVVKGSGYAPTNQLAADDPDYLGDFYEENPNHRAAQQQIEFLGPWFAYPGERGVRVTDIIMDDLRDILDTDVDPEETLLRVGDRVRSELKLQ